MLRICRGYNFTSGSTSSSPCPVLQYAQNSQGVLGWGIQLLAIGVAQPTNATTTLPCQNQFGK